MALQFSELNIPLLILSDAPESHSGLSRIARDIAMCVNGTPKFKVGFLARGGIGRRAFPFMQYNYPADTGQWGEEYLPMVWPDFAGHRDGVIFSNWDASRMLWFAQPSFLPPHLQKFYGAGRRFAKWGYFPVDGTGPHGGLTEEMVATFVGFDRVLVPSQWAYTLLRENNIECDYLPHMINTSIFNCDYSTSLKHDQNIAEYANGDKIQVGCVMSNQARKDWPTAFGVFQILKQVYGNRIQFWVHTDELVRYWNMYALAKDYGVGDSIIFTPQLNDFQMKEMYQKSAITILPTGGEGFGYPIVESQACGTPCITTAYAGGAEYTPEQYRVEPVCTKVETVHNIRRAVNAPGSFMEVAIDAINHRLKNWTDVASKCHENVEFLSMENQKFPWRRWFVEGAQ